ncbi:MAG: hypothetical protein FWG81_09830 [Betaproteobacteria bacterium]|nr:hypothetical protein [Betaproteobacteria bacterium]
MSPQKGKRNLLVVVLTSVALVAIIAAYFSPIWWMALTAPNYPEELFPDGIRVHIHFNGIFNGCAAVLVRSGQDSEIVQHGLSEDSERYNPILEAGKNLAQEVKSVDCVHEINVINKYIGMYPIAAGAPVEKMLAKFFFGFFAVMLIAFMLPRRKTRVIVLTLGFAAVAAWMLIDQYALGALENNIGYYMEGTSAYFSVPEQINEWRGNARLITHIVIVGLMLSMIIVIVGVVKTQWFTMLLVLVPMLLPVFFVIIYSVWLWFFGHNLPHVHDGNL